MPSITFNEKRTLLVTAMSELKTAVSGTDESLIAAKIQAAKDAALALSQQAMSEKLGDATMDIDRLLSDFAPSVSETRKQMIRKILDQGTVV